MAMRLLCKRLLVICLLVVALVPSMAAAVTGSTRSGLWCGSPTRPGSRLALNMFTARYGSAWGSRVCSWPPGITTNHPHIPSFSPPPWLSTRHSATPAQIFLSAVVTNRGFSDWSTQKWPVAAATLRVRKVGCSYVIEVQPAPTAAAGGDGADAPLDTIADDQPWEQVR